MNRRDFLGWLGVGAGGLLLPMRRPLIFDMNPGNRVISPERTVPRGVWEPGRGIVFRAVDSGFRADGVVIHGTWGASARYKFGQTLASNGGDIRVTNGVDGYWFGMVPPDYSFELTGRWGDQDASV
jgi:hypothetical protein